MVDVNKVYEMLERDLKFVEFMPTEEMRLAMKPAIEAIPEIMADLLGEKATLENILKAKAVFLRYLLENGVMKNVCMAAPEEMMGLFYNTHEELADASCEGLKEAMEEAEGVAQNLAALLEEYGSTEESVLAKMELTLKDTERTVGELFMEKPYAIIRAR